MVWSLLLLTVSTTLTLACPGGYKLVHRTNADAGTCQPCPAGSFSPEGELSCFPCPSGSIAAEAGQSECTPCSMGSYAKSATECAACPAGTYSAQKGAAMCAACEAGWIADVGGSASCHRCAEGEYAESSTSCKACPAGTMSVGSECVFCPPGTSAKRGSSKCIPCESGEFAESYGQAACGKCPIGTFSKAGSTECVFVDCPTHSFRTSSGSGCQCREGYVGTIVFNEVAGRYDGECRGCDMGYWSTEGAECKTVPCPANSDSHPMCRCKEGFTGYLWWSGGSYTGVCTESGCPLNSVRSPSPSSLLLTGAGANTTSTSPSLSAAVNSNCSCVAGYVPATITTTMPTSATSNSSAQSLISLSETSINYMTL